MNKIPLSYFLRWFSVFVLPTFATALLLFKFYPSAGWYVLCSGGTVAVALSIVIAQNRYLKQARRQLLRKAQKLVAERETLRRQSQSHLDLFEQGVQANTSEPYASSSPSGITLTGDARISLNQYQLTRHRLADVDCELKTLADKWHELGYGYSPLPANDNIATELREIHWQTKTGL